MLGQCSPTLWVQLEGTKGHKAVNTHQDIDEILQMICRLCCCHDQNNDETNAGVTSLKSLLIFYQKPNITNITYLKEFKV